jgi:transcriptional regulator with XRE-family HTH domain
MEYPRMRITWRDRLRDALERSGKTMRAASMEADCGPGYLHDILNTEREPSVDRLAKIAMVLGTSLTWLWTGYEIDANAEKFLKRMAEMPDAKRRAIYQLIVEDETAN